MNRRRSPLLCTFTNGDDNRKNANETSYLTTPQDKLFSTGATLFIAPPTHVHA